MFFLLSNFGEQIKKQKASETDEAVVSIATGSISGLIGGKRANSKGVLTKAINDTKSKISRETRRANQKYAAKAIARAKSTLNSTLEFAIWESSFNFLKSTTVSNTIKCVYGSVRKCFAN